MPASIASRTVAIASARLVGPQTCPMPPPPSVRQLISPSFPNGLCSVAIILRFQAVGAPAPLLVVSDALGQSPTLNEVALRLRILYDD
jgi:hypothetical protein